MMKDCPSCSVPQFESVLRCTVCGFVFEENPTQSAATEDSHLLEANLEKELSESKSFTPEAPRPRRRLARFLKPIALGSILLLGIGAVSVWLEAARAPIIPTSIFEATGASDASLRSVAAKNCSSVRDVILSLPEGIDHAAEYERFKEIKDAELAIKFVEGNAWIGQIESGQLQERLSKAISPVFIGLLEQSSWDNVKLLEQYHPSAYESLLDDFQELVVQECNLEDLVSEVTNFESKAQTIAALATSAKAFQKRPQESAPKKASLGELNALEKAKSYLMYSPFSKTGLQKQLEFEGYSSEEATYATDRVGANWNEQAALKAADYLNYSNFSRQGLIDQLLFEGFTAGQAEYGVNAVGY